MKVLWFTGTKNSKSRKGFYGGGGWIRSLSEQIIKNSDITLAHSFHYDLNCEPWVENGILQYPVATDNRNKFQKLYYNWIGYRNEPFENDTTKLMKIVEDFKPDVIQIFGIETSFPSIQKLTNIPVIIYLQGILNPISNAFFPPGINNRSFLFSKISKQEWLLNNGFRFLNNLTKLKSKRELLHFEDVKYLIGRTKWDYKVSSLFAPNAKYFVLNEMLRTEFYESNKWNKKYRDKYIIYSTISNVTYKGLDVILKTALLLKQFANLKFEWHIAGITSNSTVVQFFESLYNIDSDKVNISYKGVLNVSELITGLLDSDVFVHPTYIDNSANSVCEAQMLGVPVIASNVGGISSLINHNSTGLLVPTNDPFMLASIIKDDHISFFLKDFSLAAQKEANERHNREKILTELCLIYNTVKNNTNV